MLTRVEDVVQDAQLYNMSYIYKVSQIASSLGRARAGAHTLSAAHKHHHPPKHPPTRPEPDPTARGVRAVCACCVLLA